MSYLQTKPTYTRTTGSSLEQWGILFLLSRDFVNTMPAGLPGLAQLGCLDAVGMIPGGGMTSTGMGNPFPLLTDRV